MCAHRRTPGGHSAPPGPRRRKQLALRMIRRCARSCSPWASGKRRHGDFGRGRAPRQHGPPHMEPLRGGAAWGAYATTQNPPLLPADPARLADFLAESAEGARGHAQSKPRECAVAAFGRLARPPSPAGICRETRRRRGCALSRAGIRRHQLAWDALRLRASGPGAPHPRSRDPRCGRSRAPPSARTPRIAASRGRQAGAGACRPKSPPSEPFTALIDSAALRWDAILDPRIAAIVSGAAPALGTTYRRPSSGTRHFSPK